MCKGIKVKTLNKIQQYNDRVSLDKGSLKILKQMSTVCVKRQSKYVCNQFRMVRMHNFDVFRDLSRVSYTIIEF